ncbi:hypothetical protein TNCV_4588111 [Trichonephila clavipes]|nr:hypothetical protein TNCV_4588111 [Trichonephila clavipes]
MSAPGFASSASDIPDNSKNNAINKETHNVSQNASGEFGLFQAINEMQRIFTLFPSLLTEMEKSSKCTDPTEKLQCLLRSSTFHDRRLESGRTKYSQNMCNERTAEEEMVITVKAIEKRGRLNGAQRKRKKKEQKKKDMDEKTNSA